MLGAIDPQWVLGNRPTVGLMIVATGELPTATEVIEALQQIMGNNPVDLEAAARLIHNRRTETADCIIEEIVEFAWSKAFHNLIGFLITQITAAVRLEASSLKTRPGRNGKALPVCGRTPSAAEDWAQELDPTGRWGFFGQTNPWPVLS